ncbi:MAG TPA: metal ABC transporter ATP-binding protein [Gemmatimonadaceae bacterium]|nr:metal ABC transporter ATP-binding protein [Gemmatimonadaceae bacterium]
MTDPLLRVEHLSLHVGATPIVRDVTFSVAAGESLAIIGPNGAGKTLLFRALIGAVPFEGTIRWKAGIRIGYVPQKLDLTRDVPITGFDFLRAKPGASTIGGTGLAAILADVGLPTAIAHLSIGSISGGQFQRLLVAFALVDHPDVLLLDEPTAGVDEPGQERLNELVARLQCERNMTVLLISHDLSVVFRHATQVLCLGREHVCVGAPRTVLTSERLSAIYGEEVALHVHDTGEGTACRWQR